MTDVAVQNRRPILALILALVALALIGGGGWLVLLGGSPYYLAAGLAVAGSAWLVLKGDRRGAWLYGVMFLATIFWSLAEAGLNPWGLQARLLAPLLLGSWVFWPTLMRLPRWLPIIGVVSVAVVGGLLLYNSGRIEKPTGADRAFASGMADWQHYGNTLAGTRFSEAAEITPANAGKLKRVWTYRTGTKIFIAASQNRAIWAFELSTGRKLWEARLPAGGHATPMTYVSPKSGRQFVVLAAGGNASLQSGSGDYVMGFALPDRPSVETAGQPTDPKTSIRR